MSPAPTSAPAAAAAEFDEFQARTWTSLLQQTLAVCGDLPTARAALRLAYVDAWREWSRATREDPDDFVRQRAWQRALWRRQRARRGDDLDQERRHVLRSLQALPVPTRKAIVLAGLSDLSLARIARILGDQPDRTRERLAQGLTSLMRSLECEQDQVVRHLQTLTAPARNAARPAPASMRRRGRWRTLGKVAGGVAVALAVSIVSGYAVYAEPARVVERPPRIGPELTQAMLLTPPRLQSLGGSPRWRTVSTTFNTEDDGINSPCQDERFADPEGRKALVRTMESPGRRMRSVVQTVELSSDERAAETAYDTVVRWFAGCQRGGQQLLESYRIDDLGDEALLLRFRAPGSRPRTLGSYLVTVARAGRLTTWTGIRTDSPRGPSVEQMTLVAADAVYRVCGSRASGPCPIAPTATALPPPPSGETPGMLAVADLPPIGSIRKPWSGTRATPAPNNPAATSCDRADFIGAGAVRTLSRTFLIPGARLPRQFGVTETYGRFPSEARAGAFVERIRDRMDRCSDQQLSARVTNRVAVPRDVERSSYFLWRLDSEVRDDVSVRFWTGVVRVGTSVVQVTFVAGGRADVSSQAFRGLVVRARDRLFEVPRTARERTLRVPSGGTTDPSATPSSSP